ncbi:hypothetical protein HDV00_007135 [Rhizophlyctis rosea]|nr:hypothetical protein HDV00_007135 [Rhizophlyctis rosea]
MPPKRDTSTTIAQTAKKRKITIEYVQQQAADPNLNSTTWNALLHEIGKEARPDLYLQNPTIRKCFSDWSWKQVAKLYNLKISSRPPPTNFPSIRLPASTMSYIQQRFQTSYTTLGSPFSGYGASRNFFVADLVFPVAELFAGALTCDPEGKLGTSRNPEHFAWAEVEFVFKVLDMVTVKLVEAKKDDVQQGDARAILEMELTGMENRGNGLGITTVYAIVTTGYLWSILSFSRTNGHTNRKTPQIHSSQAITLPHTALHNKFTLRYESASYLESVAVKEEDVEKKVGEGQSGGLGEIGEGKSDVEGTAESREAGSEGEGEQIEEGLEEALEEEYYSLQDLDILKANSEKALAKATSILEDIRKANNDAKSVKAFGRLRRFCKTLEVIKDFDPYTFDE